jgi:beta-lactam-binding protein with PASTA domain
MAGSAQAQPGAQGQTANTLLGEIENLHITDINDPWSSGWLRIGGQDVILPRNLLIDLPANRLTLQQIFLGAPPACVALGQSGLAQADTCLEGRSGAYATTMIANRLGTGEIVVGEIWIDKGIESITGFITGIDHTDGYFRINGQGNTPGTGTMVRINDPNSRHTIQKGLGCAGWFDNCSPDPRFTNDDLNYTIASTTGYPVCIPSTQASSTVEGGARAAGSDANGVGDPFCPATNRNVIPVSNSTRFAPLRVGDHVTVEGNFEVVNGVRFLSTFDLTMHEALFTRNDPSQPDYITFEEVEWDAPRFDNGRQRMLIIGFTSLAGSQLDIYALRANPADNVYYEDVIASTVNNPDSTGNNVGFAGFGGLFRFQYDVDFQQATNKPERLPCSVLANAGFTKCAGQTIADNFMVLSPISREIIGRSRRTLNPGVVTRDINGLETTSGEYLTPLGIGHPEQAEIDLNAFATPYVLEGEVWNWDRRLSPGGCLESGCETTPQPLDPFPLSGLDARTISSGGANPAPVPNRIFTFFTPTGNTITHPNGLVTQELQAQLLTGIPTPPAGTIPPPPPFPPSGTVPPVPGGLTTPNVIGLSADQATAVVNAFGLLPNVTSANDAAPAGQIFAQAPAAGEPITLASTVSFVVSLGPANVAVPNVVGLSQAAGETAIAGAGLTLGTVTTANSATVAAGLIISQDPAAGGIVAPSSAVSLVVSLGPATVTVTAPNVVGLSQTAAESAISGAGLTLGAVTTANSATVPAGQVISQNPVAGSNVLLNSAVALVVSLGPSPGAPAGLVAAFNFDETDGLTAIDSSPSGGNGTITGAVRVPGRVGTALSFDGVNDLVTVPNSQALTLTTAMTLEAWVQPNALTGWHTVLLKEGVGTMAYEMYANNDVSRPAAYFTTPGGAIRAITGTAVLPTNAWTHLATTYDGTTMRLFVNGVQVRSVLRSGAILATDGPLHIGGNEVWGGEFFSGLIDEVRVYNRALTGAEIAADMAAGTSPTP